MSMDWVTGVNFCLCVLGWDGHGTLVNWRSACHERVNG